MDSYSCGFAWRKRGISAESLEKYERSHNTFLLTLKDADLVGGKLWDEALRRLLIGVLHANESPACILYKRKLLWVRLSASRLVGSGDIWFDYDTNRQNAAHHCKLKAEIPQEGLGKAAGRNRYLTEPVDV